MKSYVIDTDILIYFLKGRKEVIEKLVQIPTDCLYTTRVNYAELLYGAYNSSILEKNLAAIEPFLDSFRILEFDEGSSKIFAKTKAQLKKRGKIIADMDLMIASITLNHGFSLVSNNIKHFERIDKLDLVRWL